MVRSYIRMKIINFRIQAFGNNGARSERARPRKCSHHPYFNGQAVCEHYCVSVLKGKGAGEILGTKDLSTYV